MLFGVQGDDKAVAAQTGINAWFLKDYKITANSCGFEGVQSALLLMHHYNLRSVGVGDVGTEDASLLKEMIYKMMM